MNGNNGNNGNKGNWNHNGWSRVNNQNNSNQYNSNQNGPYQYNGSQQGSNYGPFGDNRGQTPKGPFDNQGRNHRKDANGINSIFELMFYFIGLSIEITFKSLEVVFQVFGEVFGGKQRKQKQGQSYYNYQDGKNNNSNYQYQQSQGNMGQNNSTNNGASYTYQDPKTAKREEKRAYKEEKRAYKAEMKEERRNERSKNETPEQEVPESKLTMLKKDGLLVLFLLMTIPLVVFVAMKQIIIAALVLGGGIVAMGLYNGIMSGLISREEKKAERAEAAEEEIDENVSESSDVEKAMEAAFNKVFEIRKDMILIPDGVVKDKIESICSISDKIIGEVRSNPELYPQSKRFFYYNLDSFNEIFNKYVKLLNYREESAETNRTLFETEKAFGNIEAIFKEILTKVLERDLINLKAEINVMKNSQ